MEGTAGRIVFAGFFKLNTRVDHIDNVNAVKKVINKCLWDQSGHECNWLSQI
jgi:hypothetical protein